MNNKLTIFLIMTSFVFGYAVYEAVKLDGKLGGNNFTQTGSVLKKLPETVDFKTMDDEVFDFKTVSDQKLFIHFWATWCGPCEVEFPELVEFINHFKNKSDLKFLIVAVNDDPKKVKKFLARFSIDNKNVFLLKDDTNSYNKFGTYKLPETFLFASGGSLVRKFPGQQVWTQEFLVNFFQNI